MFRSVILSLLTVALLPLPAVARGVPPPPFLTFMDMQWGSNQNDVYQVMTKNGFSLKDQQGTKVDCYTGAINGSPVNVIALYTMQGLQDLDVQYIADRAGADAIYYTDIQSITVDLREPPTIVSNPSSVDGYPTGIRFKSSWYQPNNVSQVFLQETDNDTVQIDYQGPAFNLLTTMPNPNT
jgi:hypothetical protein